MNAPRRPLLIMLLVLASPVLAVRFADAAERELPVASATSTGAVGVGQSVAQIMRAQAAVDASGRAPKDMEGEVEQPDRSNLPQNPASPASPAGSGLPSNGKTDANRNGLLSPQTLGTNFTAATLQGVNPTLSFPPDVMGAVGPSQFVTFVNGRLVTFNKSTGVADGVLNTDTDVFFSSVLAGSSTSDPRIRYDRLSARWILVIISVSVPNRILIAVSDAASAGVITPSTVFTRFFIPIASTPPTISNTCLADYPTLGVDAGALYIGTNNFCGASLTFNSTDGYVVRKSSVLGAGPIVVTAFRGLVATAGSSGPYTPQGVDNLDPAATEGYFIGVDNLTFGTLMFRRVSNPAGTPTISGNLSITVPTTRSPILVPHLGNSGGNPGRLDALDDRLFAAHLRNGRLWTAHNFGVTNTGATSGTATRNASRWYELNVPVGSGTPTLVQSGTVFTASGSNSTDQRHYWIPSIMVSGQGHAAMGFSVAGTNERANAATVGRLAGDAPGTMQTPVLFTSSTTPYNPPSDPGGSGGRRWGDYSYTSLDPLDDQTMWTTQEFCDASNSYGVRVVKLIAPPPATPSTIANVTEGQNPANVTLTGASIAGSGFWDPGTNLPGVPPYAHVAASVVNGGATGTPPTVVSAVYVNPTTLQLTLDASSATANLPGEKYTVQVTNPDGQSTSAAVLTVVDGTPVATLGSGVTLDEGNAGSTPLEFTVNLSSPAVASVVVRYQTSDGTATVSDNDYVAVTDSITILPGNSSGPITLNANGDTRFENGETFVLTLTSATHATLGATVAAAGSLTNDDAPPSLTIDDLVQAEGDADSAAFTFTLSLSTASGLPVSADFATADSTATTLDSDYRATSGSVNFAADQLTQSITVFAFGDTVPEADEVFNVVLSNPAGALMADSVGRGVLENDDEAPALSIGDVIAVETQSGSTTFEFPVTLSYASGLPVTVAYQTSDGSATIADGDYDAVSDVLVIPALALSGSISVTIHGDACGESDETFAVTLASPTAATLADAVASGTLQNDDDAIAPSVAVTAPNGAEVLSVGTSSEITWNAADDVAVSSVDVLLSRDGGTSYPEALATGIANTGSFAWNVSPPTVAAGAAFVRVVAHDAGCNVTVDSSDAGFEIVDGVTAVTPVATVTEFALGAVHPNPSHGTARVDYELPREAHVRMSVFDIRGREVARLVDGRAGAGRHQTSWDGNSGGRPAGSGVYFMRFRAGDRNFQRRFVLAR
ncbi:MAG: T9SS type A sorting domain-containing protein [Candidatus Eisenbacteria bacterium]|uniref:T9SS type A sorting domain-containing protein n=1 Tax=Eiseniibacteriota bacterium TaxID=2212470 RepID=A0A849SE36_UNCEI|nr:T9SS type A sorting domain-containing protein [Candidatus Eisenbacteria bacterium]